MASDSAFQTSAFCSLRSALTRSLNDLRRVHPRRASSRGRGGREHHDDDDADGRSERNRVEGGDAKEPVVEQSREPEAGAKAQADAADEHDECFTRDEAGHGRLTGAKCDASAELAPPF